MYEYLNDMEFLMQLDKLQMRVQYAKIVLLTFKDEKPIREIQGNISAGSVSVNGSSSMRRTLTLTMLANPENSNIEDIDNEISINKKVKVFVGYKNPLKDYITLYGETVWFPCGMFVLSSASIARSTGGWTISISGKDKMCLLDGTAGGTLPASTTFHESLVYLDNGDYEIQYPTIYQIIYEAVNHWGGEPIENIIISDVDETCKLLVKYIGDDPVYFDSNYESLSFTRDDDHQEPCYYNQDAGYEETSFTYPSELILNAGDTVVTLLEKIKDTLGNYEYFYDIWGHFVFQKIKNYLDDASPLTELVEENYVKTYDNAKFLYSLTDLDTTTAITRSPKYDNVKNDFYVWGQRTESSGTDVSIRYHLAIDEKPDLDLANQYMWKVSADSASLAEQKSKIEDSISEVEASIEAGAADEELANLTRQLESYNLALDNIETMIDSLGSDYTGTLIIRYDFTDDETPPTVESGYTVTLVGGKCNEWREELYRQALDAQVTNSVYDNYYDSELIAEWRELYDPTKEEWASTTYTVIEDGEEVTKTASYYNPDVFDDPGSIDYWLDFIDTGSALGKYSVKEIGRRTKVVNNTSIKSVYNKETPDIIFMNGYDQETIANYTETGQKFFVLTDEYYDLFTTSSTGTSCFDQIRELMYQNLNYNTTISLTCLPKYYMEPNNIIRIEDKESGISGNYQITQFTLPLAYNGTMSITATEVLTRV